MSEGKTLDLGSEGHSFPFDNIGDSITGRIVDFEEMQQTDMNTGKPAAWDDGKPKMMLRVDLQTTLRDDEHDDGVRSVFLSGSKKVDSGSKIAAVTKAIKAATGGNAIQVGATLTLAYSGSKPAAVRGHNPAKLYTAAYVPKTAAVAHEPAHHDPIAAHPQGAQLRAAGVADDVIRQTLGLG